MQFAGYEGIELLKKHRGPQREVWKVRDSFGPFKRCRVLKIFGHDLDPKIAEGELNGAWLARKLPRGLAPRIIRMGQSAGATYVLAELLSGPSLSEKIRQGILAEQGIAIVVEILGILEQLRVISGKDRQDKRFRGIANGDCKPSNFLFDGKQIKLADFGTAVGLSGGAGKVVACTARYAAPEQMLENRVSHQSDVFGAGQILAEILTGDTAYRNKQDSPGAIPAYSEQLQLNVPALIAPVLAKALALKEKDRYATAGEFLGDLRDVLTRMQAPEDETMVPDSTGAAWSDPRQAKAPETRIPETRVPGIARLPVSSPQMSPKLRGRIPRRLTRIVVMTSVFAGYELLMFGGSEILANAAEKAAKVSPIGTKLDKISAAAIIPATTSNARRHYEGVSAGRLRQMLEHCGRGDEPLPPDAEWVEANRNVRWLVREHPDNKEYQADAVFLDGHRLRSSDTQKALSLLDFSVSLRPNWDLPLFEKLILYSYNRGDSQQAETIYTQLQQHGTSLGFRGPRALGHAYYNDATARWTAWQHSKTPAAAQEAQSRFRDLLAMFQKAQAQLVNAQNAGGGPDPMLQRTRQYIRSLQMRLNGGIQ
jgi:serine/threonine protein kinase